MHNKIELFVYRVLLVGGEYKYISQFLPLKAFEQRTGHPLVFEMSAHARMLVTSPSDLLMNFYLMSYK